MRRTREKLAALPGVRSVRRPVTPVGAEEFDLYYVRSGRRGGVPLVIVPGGPGMASIAGYPGLRKHAAALGLDVVMVEHRGVGMSRRDDSGADLPAEALTIEQVVDDIGAVLDDAGIDTAIAYGTSYGTYLAAGLGVRHPSRVRAMVLDSPLLSCDDFELVRSHCRDLWWHDDSAIAVKMHALTEAGRLLPEDLTIAAAVFGLGGPDVLEHHLDLLMDGRRALWAALRGIVIHAARRKVPYQNEPDLVGPIGFRELNFVGSPDGLPLDTTLTWRGVPGADTPFEGEPFDLVTQMPGFDWPTVVVSGGRDLIAPPAVADRIAELVPRATLVRLPTGSHSVLDTREPAALRIMAEVAAGRPESLAARGAELDALPATWSMRLTPAALGLLARLASVLPRFGGVPVAAPATS